MAAQNEGCDDMSTFKHSGDMGDVIYSLPTIKALGGGVLYLDPEGGQSEPLVGWPNHTRTKLNAAAIESVRELLMLQDYIEDVRYWHVTGEGVDYNLDEFRRHCTPDRNIAHSHLMAFDLPLSHADEQWLWADTIDCSGVVSRSLRYHGNYSFWDETDKVAMAEMAVFVGLPQEWQYFKDVFGINIAYSQTPTIYDAARLIGGCQHFIGNQNLCRAIAEGFKRTVTVEEYRIAPNTRFLRSDARYV